MRRTATRRGAARLPLSRLDGCVPRGGPFSQNFARMALPRRVANYNPAFVTHMRRCVLYAKERWIATTKDSCF